MLLEECSLRKQWMIYLFFCLCLGSVACASLPPETAPPSHRYVPVAHGYIEYYEVGAGSPIVLIPGFATDVSSWSKTFIMALARHHRLILINNRNIGGSRVQSSSYTSQDLAYDLSQLIHMLHLKKPMILGISMGGMIAQQLAVLYPDQVGHLVLINTAVPGHYSVHPKPAIEKRMLDLPQHILGFYVAALNTFFPPPWKSKMAYRLVVDRFQPPRQKMTTLHDMMTMQRPLVLHWLQEDRAWDKIARLTMPTLIINGKADIVIPPLNSVILSERIPHAKLLQWEDGGHAILFQYPEEIAAEIHVFREAQTH